VPKDALPVYDCGGIGVVIDKKSVANVANRVEGAVANAVNKRDRKAYQREYMRKKRAEKSR
jgi:hypothetical protein